MPRFRFRLETLRRLREMNRDELRTRLSEAFQAEQILARQRASVAAEEVELAESQRRMMQSESLDVGRLLEVQRYHLALDAQSRRLAKQAAKIAEEVEVRRQAVVEADRQVRVLDKLRERRLEQHRQSQQAAEAKRLDDVATTRWERER